MAFCAEKIDELEKHLENNPYLSEGHLPAALDAEVFFQFKGISFFIL